MRTVVANRWLAPTASKRGSCKIALSEDVRSALSPKRSQSWFDAEHGSMLCRVPD